MLLRAAIALGAVELLAALILVALICVYFLDERDEKRELEQRAEDDELEALYKLPARLPSHRV